MEVILVYLILGLVLILNENGSENLPDQDHRVLEKSDYPKNSSEQLYYRYKKLLEKQPEYVRYSEIEDLDIKHSRSTNSPRKI